jgi:hypothetical protein
MQKHVIRTIQQEETEKNKEKYLKGHCRRRITNGCDAIHKEYYHIPKETVERTEVEKLSDNTILC